ncbi:MAG TPA: FAD-dependent 5-carboxymethylaminomethyl-2-thiouridine(34) oxidoreductase MnmC [Burkholderiales bacterium]|nr:FAD-dependent 5-carboxymethylaminomethyl-2-thiouridine(34) oxidoreductase MnmC [Burkholderiales bacterium]
MPITPARLVFQDGVPYSEAFEDVYHNAQGGGVAKKRHVFLAGNGLPERWAGRRRFVILETGFGLGLNFLVVLHAWRRDSRRCERLHFVSFEKSPFTLQDMRLAHEGYPELAEEAAALHAAWPPLVPGAHRLELEGGKVVLTLFFSDQGILRDIRASADAVFLDGFSPAKNAEMWSPQVMRAISRLCAPDATAATWSVAADVRKALQDTGFEVEKRPGFGNKREMLVARNRKQGQATFSPPERRAVVIGAGLAGAALCERLCARGWEVDLYERHAAPAQEASGNLAGIFHPLATADDSFIARLTRAGFLYSVSRWKALGGVRWDPCGVLQLARTEKEDASQRRAVAGMPAEYVQYATREEASAHAGVPLPAGGLWFPGAGWIQPRTLVEAQLAACGDRLRRIFSSEVKSLPENRIAILANSAEAPKLHPVPHLRLRRVRGQLTHVPEAALEPPHVVLLRGGMVLPPVDGVCVTGASFDIDDEDSAPRAESDQGNLERLKHILGQLPTASSLENRVAFRAVTRDRLPVAGKIAEGVYGAFAYGSRGLVWAALAAELIASELEGEPLPVEGSLARALDPMRFRRRAESRGSRP